MNCWKNLKQNIERTKTQKCKEKIMSTRSLICIQRGKNKYEAIYCHSDGYLTYNGQMLNDHYNDREKVEKLIKLGNISCLNEKIDPDPTRPHSFDYSERQDDVTVAYGRDRGEKGQESTLCSMQELKDWDWIEYIYIFNTKNEWIYSGYPFDEFKNVKEDLEDYYKKLGIKRPKDFYGYMSDDYIKKLKKQQEGEM